MSGLALCYTNPFASWLNFQRFMETMRGIQGALIITACFQTAMGFLGFWRNAVRYIIHNFQFNKFLGLFISLQENNVLAISWLLISLIACWIRFLSPLSVVPYVTLTGFGLYHLGFPMVKSSKSFVFTLINNC